MKSAMEFLGQALLAYSKGDKSHFYLVDSFGAKYLYDLNRYFRKPEELEPVEKELIAMCCGDILDVGSSTGYYIPEMMKRGKVTSIEISESMNRINSFGKTISIFNMPEDNKSDTITFLENSIGMGGSLEGTKKLLIKLKSILKQNGQILAILRKMEGDYDIQFYPVWKGKRGDLFSWVNFNVNYLANFCREFGFDLKVLYNNEEDDLIILRDINS